MSERNQKVLNFLKKNIYYFIFLLCLTVLTIVVIAVAVTSKKNNVVEVPNNEQSQTNNNDGQSGIQDVPTQTPNQTPDTPDTTPTNPPVEDETNKDVVEVPDEPVVSVIVFDMPVNGTIIKEYVAAGVVYSNTLGLYTGHKAIDFSAEEGAPVMACYDGVIESITESQLTGITLIIDHGNGLRSVYNSIEIADGIVAGMKVIKGTILGGVSTNNRREYKDGPHLHFEVTENGVKVDPNKYLLTEEK